MSKKVTIEVSPEGKMKFDFDGFSGQACFTEAQRLKEVFASFGLDVDTQRILETKNEVEVRKIENSQSVGG